MARGAVPSCAGLHDRPFNEFGVCETCCTPHAYDDGPTITGYYDRVSETDQQWETTDG